MAKETRKEEMTQPSVAPATEGTLSATPAQPVVDAAAIATRIGSAGVDASARTAAPVSGKQVEEPAPGVEQPAKETPPVTPEPAKVETPAAPEPITPAATDEKPPEAKPEEPPKNDESEFFLRAGLQAPEPETVETLSRKYQESSKEAHRLTDLDRAKMSVLADLGLELVPTKTGFALKATDKYRSELKDEDIPNVFADLSEEQKGFVDEEVAKDIVKRTVAALNAKRPPAEQKVVDVQLPVEAQNEVFTELQSAKLPSGQQVYPDIGEEAMQSAMGKLFYHPSMASLQRFANESKDNFRIVVNLLHGACFRAIAPQKAVQRDAEEQKRLKQEKIEKTVSTLPRTAGDQTRVSPPKASENVAARIGKAR